MGSPDIQFDRPVTCGSSVGNGARVAPDRGRVHGRRVSRYVITLRASYRIVASPSGWIEFYATKRIKKKLQSDLHEPHCV